MKKIVKVTSVILVFVMILATLTSCSSKYSSLRKAFEKEGYAENTTFTGIANTIKEELGKEDYAVELHLLTKSNGITSALVIEFKSTKEMAKAFNESETLQGLTKDISKNEDVNKVYNALKDAGYAAGNCLVVPISLLYTNEITNIVKSVK